MEKHKRKSITTPWAMTTCLASLLNASCTKIYVVDVDVPYCSFILEVNRQDEEDKVVNYHNQFKLKHAPSLDLNIHHGGA